LHSILTSSQFDLRLKSENSKRKFHGVFKRPHNSQRSSRPIAYARTPPPAFLFPIQQCQRPKPDRSGSPFNARCGGGRFLVAPPNQVNQLSKVFSCPIDQAQKPNPKDNKKPRGQPRLASQIIRSRRSEVAETKQPSPIKQGKLSSPKPKNQAAASASAASRMGLQIWQDGLVLRVHLPVYESSQSLGIA
jgi:hypothetical protein